MNYAKNIKTKFEKYSNHVKINGDCGDIDPEITLDFGVSIPIKKICELSDIEYVGQSARIVEDKIEIDPAQEGLLGISVSIDSLVRFTKK